MAGVAPEPKFHNHVTPVMVPVLVKLTGKPVHCGAVEENVDNGVELIVMVCIEVWVQNPSLIVKVIVFVPPEEYKTPTGFSEVEV